MKKRAMFFAALCALCSALDAQQVFYEGQGGKALGGINVSPITGTGLSGSEAELLPLIQMTLHSDFQKYAGIAVADLVNPKIAMRHTLTGTITKTGDRYFLHLNIKDEREQTVKASYSIQCTLEELRSLKAIKTASEELITQMGVKLTEAGKTALRTTATKEAEAMNTYLKSIAAGATEFEKAYYTYQASELDPSLAEAARRRAAYQPENYQLPVIDLTMPDIIIPEIKAPQFKAPEIKMAATGNIGADARKQLEQYEAQKEVSRLRQESGNKALKDMQDAFLAQFKAQSEAVKKQQAELLKQRDMLLGQQRTLLAQQRQTIAQLRDTENSYDGFFMEHPPFEIIYDPAAATVGNANLEQGTINLQFQITSTGTATMEPIPLMLADFINGLGTIMGGLTAVNAEFDRIQTLLAQAEAAGNSALAQLVNDYASQMTKVRAAEDKYAAELAKLDRSLGTSGYAQLGRDYAVRPDTGYAQRLAREYAVRPAGYNAAKDQTRGDTTWSLTKWNKDDTRTFAIEARLENDRGKTIGTASVSLTNQIRAAAYTQPQSDSVFCVFIDVPVADITDGMKVSIRRVNSRDITRPENADYIKVSPLEPDGFTKDGYDIAGYDRRGYNAFGWDRAGYGRDGYNKEGRDRDGYYRTGWDRDGYDRDGYNSAGWDKDGYNKEGRDKDGFDRKDRQRQYQKERDREAAEERKARSRQFAKERLAGEIWAGGIFDGAFIGGANFIVRLGRELHNTLFPLGLMAEASFQTPDAIKIDSNVGGGLRLALDLTGDGGWYINLGLSVSGGVSFIDNAAVPYLHIRGFAPVILPLTSGVFIHFYPDGVDSAWYIGAKLRIP